MTIQRAFYRFFIRILEGLLMLRPFSSCFRSNLSNSRLKNSKGTLDIVTIAFNNEQIIEHQIRLLRKYVQGVFTYIVADNSSDKEVSGKIKDLCISQNVSYVRLPKNYLGIVGASYSHSVSLNWVYRKIIRKRQPQYFGFIDHDLFPIAPFSIEKKIENQPIYGRLSEREPFWYLWAGLCFFRFDAVKNKRLDFLPITLINTYLDSGGGVWKELYSVLDKQKLSFCSVREEQIREGGDYHSDFIQYMDDCWLHLINGSNWANRKPKNLSYLLQKKKSVWIEKASKSELIDLILNKY